MLGGGGLLGGAWTVGTLYALQEAAGLDVRSVDVTIGTSVGGVLAALMAAGASVRDLVDHQRGVPASGPLASYDIDDVSDVGGAAPGLPQPGIGSWRLLARALRHPRCVTPLAVGTALVTHGRRSLTRLGSFISSVLPDGQWPPGLHVVAMNYHTGARVPFGRPDSPPAGPSEAVMASCAVPGWYAPVPIGGCPYVDGGACSTTNADLAAGLGLDHVYVVAPMAAAACDRPSSMVARLERRWRRAVNSRLSREIRKVEASGAEVTVLAPGPCDLAEMGVNLMAPDRRLSVLETALQTGEDAFARGGLGWPRRDTE